MLWYVNVNCILNAIFYHSSLGLCVIMTTRVIAVRCFASGTGGGGGGSNNNNSYRYPFLFISGCRAQFTSLRPLSRDMCWQILCMIASRCNSNSSGCQIQWMMWDVVLRREQWNSESTRRNRKVRELWWKDEWWKCSLFSLLVYVVVEVLCHCVMNFKRERYRWWCEINS